MAEKPITIQITGDESDLKKALQKAAQDISKFDKTAEEAGKQSGAAFNSGVAGGLRASVANIARSFGQIQTNAAQGFSGIASSFVSLAVNPITLAAASLGAAVVGAFQFAKIGEENERIGRTFERFATDAGLNAERLKERIAGIAAGFVDLEDILPRAGEAILALGKNAAKLPEVLTLARNIAVQTGRDVTEVFQELTKGIENQNVRLLRNNSIRLDGQRVLEDYARAQGVTVAQLSEAAKQQAFLNATLEQGAKKFKDNASQAAPLQGGIKKLQLAFDDLKDAIASIVNSNLGSTFASFVSGAASATKAVASFFTPKKETQTLNDQILELEETIKKTQQWKLDNPAFSEGFDRKLAEATTKLEGLRAKQAEIDKQNEQASQLTKSEIVAGESEAERTARIEKERQLQAEIGAIKAEALATEQQAFLDHQVALATIEADGNANSLAARQALFEAGLVKNEMEYEAAIAKNAKIADLDKRSAADSLALEKKKLADQRINDQESVQNARLTAEARRQIEAQLFAAFATLAEGNAEATKLIQVAQAVRNTYQGATLALATYPPPFGAAAAAATVALGLAQVGKITAANSGALVESGQVGKDTNPFLLSKGEIVAPAKSFDEVVEGTARQRGFVKSGDNSETDALLRELIDKIDARSVSVTVNTDVVADENGINALVARIRDAIDFNAAPALG